MKQLILPLRFLRNECPVCGRKVAMLHDGSLWRHGYVFEDALVPFVLSLFQPGAAGLLRTRKAKSKSCAGGRQGRRAWAVVAQARKS